MKLEYVSVCVLASWSGPLPPSSASSLTRSSGPSPRNVAKAAPGSTVPLHLTANIERRLASLFAHHAQGRPHPHHAALAENPAVESRPQSTSPNPNASSTRTSISIRNFQKEADFPRHRLNQGRRHGPGRTHRAGPYQACNDKQCLPPRRRRAAVHVNVDPAAADPGASPSPPDTPK